MREDRGELECNDEFIGSLISLDDIKGDLHLHTVASDGKCTLEQMALAAQAIGYEYINITDHSKSSAIANVNPNMPEKGHWIWWGSGSLGAALLALELTSLFLPVHGTKPLSAEVGENFGSPKLLAEILFKEFVLPFEIASILLLVALIGAVVLAKREL